MKVNICKIWVSKQRRISWYAPSSLPLPPPIFLEEVSGLYGELLPLLCYQRPIFLGFPLFLLLLHIPLPLLSPLHLLPLQFLFSFPPFLSVSPSHSCPIPLSLCLLLFILLVSHHHQLAIPSLPSDPPASVSILFFLVSSFSAFLFPHLALDGEGFSLLFPSSIFLWPS